MHWIALRPHDAAPEGRTALGWQALAFTPRVALVDEAVLLEVASTRRLWQGYDRLLARIFESNMAPALAGQAQAATSLIAIARLRLLRAHPDAPPQRLAPDALPLATLSAAQPHRPVLARLGCRTWGDLRALPRAGVARRFGAALLGALDQAYGERPESYPWLTLPERFEQALDLPLPATGVPGLQWAIDRLLERLQAWLGAHARGVLALELQWSFDQRRLDGEPLPPHARQVVRTAQPTQGITHLRRLLDEHLARVRLAAPVNRLALRTLETAPWAGASVSLLPGEQRPGEPLHQLVERLAARLGPAGVLMCEPSADHRPERMQRWREAAPLLAQALGDPARASRTQAAPLAPSWLLAAPQPLAVLGERPQHGGAPLRRLTRLHRIETGWWEAGHSPIRRDYFIAHSARAGLVWVYREQGRDASVLRWYRQGLYA